MFQYSKSSLLNDTKYSIEMKNACERNEKCWNLCNLALFKDKISIFFLNTFSEIKYRFEKM